MNMAYKRYFVLLFGLFVATVAFNLFLLPANIVATGSFGFILITNSLFGWDTATTALIMNLVLIAISFLIIDRGYAIKAFAGAVIFLPLFMKIIPVPTTPLLDDKVLTVLVAGILNGICVFCLFYSNGSAGGTTIVGKIIVKFGHVKLSTGIAISDGIVVICGFFVFSSASRLGLHTALQNSLLGLLSIATTKIVAHFLETGFKRTNCIFIISDNFGEIREKLVSESNLKITLIDGEAGRNKQIRKIIMCAVHTPNLRELRKQVLSADKDALIIVSGASEIYGKDFMSNLI